MTATVVGSRERLLALTLHLRHAAATSAPVTATEESILATAISLFTSKGYAGASMREIASQVGIKAASIYAHFPDGKEEMLRVALHNILTQFLGYVTRDIDIRMSPLEQLRSVVRRHVAWQLENGSQALAWDAAINQFGVMGVLDQDARAAILREQALYHDYLYELVLDVTGSAAARDLAVAIQVICDQAPAWARSADDRPTPSSEVAMPRILNLVGRILLLPDF